MQTLWDSILQPLDARQHRTIATKAGSLPWCWGGEIFSGQQVEGDAFTMDDDYSSCWGVGWGNHRGWPQTCEGSSLGSSPISSPQLRPLILSSAQLSFMLGRNHAKLFS